VGGRARIVDDRLTRDSGAFQVIENELSQEIVA